MTSSMLYRINKTGGKIPVFFVPAAATTSYSFAPLSRSLDSAGPFYAFETTAMNQGQSADIDIENLASRCVLEILSAQPSGPYFLGGHCWGGTLAFAIADRLIREGREVAALLMLESLPPIVAGSTEEIQLDATEPSQTEVANAWMWEQMQAKLSNLPAKLSRQFAALSAWQGKMSDRYRARRIAAPISLLRTETHPAVVYRGWAELGAGDVNEAIVPGDALSILNPPHVVSLAAAVDAVLKHAEERSGNTD